VRAVELRPASAQAAGPHIRNQRTLQRKRAVLKSAPIFSSRLSGREELAGYNQLTTLDFTSGLAIAVVSSLVRRRYLPAASTCARTADSSVASRLPLDGTGHDFGCGANLSSGSPYASMRIVTTTRE
jgi:hypothetical protein